MEQYKKYGYSALALLIAVAVGYAVGRHLQPAEVKTEIKEVEKVVEKIKKDIVIVEREVRNPDGTVVVDRRTEDRSEEAVRRDSRRSEEIIVSMPAKWRAGVDVKASLTNFVPQYGATVGYRAFGPVWVEASGYQDGTAVIRGVWEF